MSAARAVRRAARRSPAVSASGFAPRPARSPTATRRGGGRSRGRRPRSRRSSSNDGSRRRARWTKSSTASSSASGATGKTCSPETCSTARLVTRSVSLGARETRRAKSGAASRRCSALSTTSSSSRSASARARVSSAGSPRPRRRRAPVRASSATSVGVAERRQLDDHGAVRERGAPLRGPLRARAASCRCRRRR